MKDSPPQVPSSKTYTEHNMGRPPSVKKTNKTSKRMKSPIKRLVSPNKSIKKGKSPSGRKYADVSEHDRKLAEAD